MGHNYSYGLGIITLDKIGLLLRKLAASTNGGVPFWSSYVRDHLGFGPHLVPLIFQIPI